MKRKRLTIIIGLSLLLLLIPVGVALAAPPFDTIVTKGETINNDIFVIDGNFEIEEGATVNGDVTVWNGDAYVAGTVNGSVVLFNGDLEATSTAVITGDCVLLNGDLNDATEAGLNCTDVENLPNFLPPLPGWLQSPPQSEVDVRVPSAANRFFGGLAEAAGRSLILAFLAFVVASLLPNHLTQVEEMARRKPIASGTVGLLTAVAIPSLVALLLPVSIILSLVCIGLLGFPIMFVMLLGLAAGVLLGWITVGDLVGQWLAGPLKLKNRSLPVTAALGTAILTFVISLMGVIAFGEGLVAFLVICVGLGATALTKFGTQAHPIVKIIEDDNAEKVTAVLETLPIEDDPADLK